MSASRPSLLPPSILLPSLTSLSLCLLVQGAPTPRSCSTAVESPWPRTLVVPSTPCRRGSAFTKSRFRLALLPLLLRWRVPPRQIPLLPLRTSLPKPKDPAAKPSCSAMVSLSSARVRASSCHSSLQIRPASARLPVPIRIPRPMDSQLRRPLRQSPHCRPLLPLHQEAAVRAEKGDACYPVPLVRIQRGTAPRRPSEPPQGPARTREASASSRPSAPLSSSLWASAQVPIMSRL
ncbi:hypothetical protein VPH35_104796 [Triticum aestivum]|uniref:uncharacterized protein n=1 Tax=Triticum aestivum TaxID=4565 RepID=UPI001D00CE28|nr:uncharacterized protein LOC123130625 [Triticum aestivum]